MGKFAYIAGNDRDWEGLSHERSGRLIIVTATCPCGATETMNSERPLPPDQFAKKFKAKGWTLGKRSACPSCRSHPKKEGQIEMASTPTTERQPSDAARVQRRMIYIALETGYDEAARRYRPGTTDETIAKEVGCAANAVKIVREEFFGPAAPPEPPEITALRTDILAAAKMAQDHRSEADRLLAQASAFEGNVQTLTNRLDRICKAQGWQ